MHLTAPPVDGDVLCNGSRQPSSGRDNASSRLGSDSADTDVLSPTAAVASRSTSFDPRTSGTESLFPQTCDPAQIPIGAALLAWRLLIIRSGEEDSVESVVLGRSPATTTQSVTSTTTAFPSTSGGGTEPPIFEVAVPKFPIASGDTVGHTLEEAARSLTAAGQDADARLGTESTLYFSDAPIRTGSGKLAKSGSDWTFSIEVKASADHQLHIKAQWRTAHVTEGRAARGLHAFTAYLGVVLSRPESQVWDLIGPSREDLDQIWAWNATLPPTIDRCIHELVSEQSVLRPHKTAVSAWDGDFSYREVETLSNTLARQLRSQAGVRVGDVVVLVFEKSRWTTPALLGVLKAGAAFVLTDPAQPEARLRTIAAQTGARAVVCSSMQEPLARRIAQAAVPQGQKTSTPNATTAEVPSAKVLVASDDTLLRHAGWGQGTSSFLPVVPPTSPMYIIFTSGSTGVPKGVVCSHANFVSGAVPRAEQVGYRDSSRVFEFASYAFDVSIDCMLCTLLRGGTVCVPSEASRLDGLGAAILASGANMAHMTPSVARVLDDGDAVMRRLDVLGLGGEAVSAGDAAAWSRLTRVIIAYGPSECTVGCTINGTVSEDNTTIGRGTGGLTWIVDPEDHDRLMPVGSVGELLIEGPVVGLGYLGEPAKTAEVFIEDPRWLVRGHQEQGTSCPSRGRKGSLYKTGDLVRYDPDGNIVFVGRKDQQVKLRGQRVELAEVEHHLHPKLPRGIKIAAEVIRPGGAEPTLVVFVSEPHHAAQNGAVDHHDESISPTAFSPALSAILAEMDNVLGEEVPRYMVPAAYIPLHEMPTLPSAKIDRKKLRALGNAMTREQLAKLRLVGTTAAKSKPATEMERALADLWRRVLGGAGDVEIGLQDSFFGLGGDSLRSMKLVSAARTEGIVLTVADVFINPTLRDMARVAARSNDDAPSTNAPIPPFSLLDDGWSPEAARQEAAALCGVEPASVEDVLPCTPLQEGLMALSAKFQDSYVAQRVLGLEDPETAARLRRAFETASRDCPILRTRIVNVPGRGLQQVVVGGTIEWRGVGCGEVQEYLRADREEQMELGKPLVRYAIVQRPESTGRADFVLTMHHALYDGWSMPLVIERVNRAYDGHQTSRPAQFAHLIRFLRDTDRAACDAYWRARLAGCASLLQFPALPYEGYITQADSLLETSVRLPPAPERTGCPDTTTVATLVRAAWALVAARYAAEQDVVFGETLTGRNAAVPGADLIEGPMITTVPLRVRVDSSATVSQFLGAVHAMTVAQIPFEHTGLQHIRRLGPDALQACELRTGLVLHPAGQDEEEEAEAGGFLGARYPASRLVPANDAEAAREALKFNTYALMLVCSLAPDGFHVMASFDSRAVSKPTMERVLERLGKAARQLCVSDAGAPLGSLEWWSGVEEDAAEFSDLLALSKTAVASEGLDASEHLWLVDPADHGRLVPRGAVGEVMLDSAVDLGLPAVEVPGWYRKVAAAGDQVERAVHLHLTGRIARFDPEGRLVSLGTKEERAQQASETPAPPPPSTLPTTSSAVGGELSAKETVLRDLWARILRTEAASIGPGDNFFRLGGDSISAMKLVSEARPAGLKLSVAHIFKNKTLSDMASVAEDVAPVVVVQPSSSSLAGGDAATGPATNGISDNGTSNTSSSPAPFSLLRDIIPQVPDFIERHVYPHLAKSSWRVDDIYPARPLQEIAVRGTTDAPRFSVRYEALYFDGHNNNNNNNNNNSVDTARLLRACAALVARNEILRTVFVRAPTTTTTPAAGEEKKRCFGVVVENLVAEVEERDLPEEEKMEAFVRGMAAADIEKPLPEGSSFVKWFLVRSTTTDNGGMALVLRISHAQYDEICLPLLLHQLAALYDAEDTTTSAVVPPSKPFSAFVHHTLRAANMASAPYWADLLRGSPAPTVLRPDHPRSAVLSAAERAHFAASRTLPIPASFAESGATTLGTLPTAAWALCLARRTGRRDVLFGEVVSGRSTGLEGGSGEVVGPCWQYVPFRVRFDGGDNVENGVELLEAVQAQHAASSAHEGMALPEIVEKCIPPGQWGPGEADWFDTVVHQAVAFVEGLDFGAEGAAAGTKGQGGLKCTNETIYPHQEPLREWKIQAFVEDGGRAMTIEVVTFEAWREYAVGLLDDVVGCLEQLVLRPEEPLGF